MSEGVEVMLTGNLIRLTDFEHSPIVVGCLPHRMVLPFRDAHFSLHKRLYSLPASHPPGFDPLIHPRLPVPVRISGFKTRLGNLGIRKTRRKIWSGEIVVEHCGGRS